MHFEEIIQKLNIESTDKKDKGTKFEQIIQRWFENDDLYFFQEQLENVFLWKDFPFKKQFSSGQDIGIDIVIKEKNGIYHSVQCKCYDDDTKVTKEEVAKFIASSNRTFKDKDEKECNFDKRFFITSNNNLTDNALKEIQQQKTNKPILVTKSHLEKSNVDWLELYNQVILNAPRCNINRSKKQLREHQQTAVEKTHNYFLTHDRGKPIMACGTGKTFTALKIAEKETNCQGLILFLVPSIALLGQTLYEWKYESTKPLKAICVCSDSKVGTKNKKDEDENVESVEDLAYPATTDPIEIAYQIAEGRKMGVMTVIFSTYQSIECVMEALDNYYKEYEAKELDLIIADEAHRTTGYFDKENETAFTMVHREDKIKAKKRLYMTATPRIYSDKAKNKIKEKNLKKIDSNNEQLKIKDESVLCSMDDPEIYGEEIYRLSFSEAVDKDLLSDYKVLIFTTSKNAGSNIKFDYTPFILPNNVDLLSLQSRILGSVSALSKQMTDEDQVIAESDPNKMKRAVVFCGTIALSKIATGIYNEVARIFKELREKSVETASEQTEKTKEIAEAINRAKKKILPNAEHIDGSMSALERDRKLENLKREPKQGYCNILTNAKCLSEGVDVPSLDAVIFLNSKKSKGDIIQSVGRVMRKAEGKDCGYIIIPVCCDNYETANEAIDNSEEFSIVWEVLNALRSHDERIDIEVNTIKAGGKSKRIKIVKIPDSGGVKDGGEEIYYPEGGQILIDFGELQKEFYAKFVEKVGTKNYIENWAKEVADLAKKEYDRISNLITDKEIKKKFDRFLKALRKNVNPTITEEQAIEMLTQQLITKPIFEALFGSSEEEENYNKVAIKGISRDLQNVIEQLEGDRTDNVYKKLDEFYKYVKRRVAHIQDDSLSYNQKKKARQEIIKELYGKFFKIAFPRVQEQLGIVYTPIEAVDFMINSVDDILKEEFGKSISDKGVNILDPFTGTGTFITRILESKRIKRADLKRKFKEELHANEIVLLAYYIASINIETTYRDLTGEYLPFKKLCLQDTFLSYEDKIRRDEEMKPANELFGENAENAIQQQETEITVIIGNPPYSMGQKSANDNAKNQSYPKLDEKIKNTYVKEAGNIIPKSLYDSYIRAFRYATERIKDKGIVCFIVNNGWLDSLSGYGFRRTLEKEFDKIYIYNLKGNQRNKGDIRKKEGGKIFEHEAMIGVCIVLLVKTGKIKPCKIKYSDIGDSLSTKEKFAKIVEAKSFVNLDLIDIEPDSFGNWLNKREDSFDQFISIYPIKKFDKETKSFFTTYSLGYITNQDTMFYNFSLEKLHNYFSEALNFYNSERERYQNSDKKIPIEDFVNKDNFKLSFNLTILNRIEQNLKINFYDSENRKLLYRPFCNQNFKDEKRLIRTISYMPKLFPNSNFANKVICIQNVKTKNYFSCIMVDKIIDIHFLGDTQNFPLYWYEKVEKSNQGELDLFAESNNGENKEEYIRRDGISDWIKKRADEQYNCKVSKEDIFYYVYGFLHLESYRKKFANNLKNELPKIPLVEDYATFEKISKAGRSLAELHLNFEPKPKENATAEQYEKYEISKVRQSDDKTKLFFYKKNGDIFEEETLDIPPEVEKWQINGSTATWWIADRYKVTVDKKTGRINDPNDYAREYGNPRYIFELAENVINIAIKTVAILDELNKIEVKI